ncbi:hypothetical protein K435DRAFT_811878 [Dendrothele bispora CBS 962.96]|uniref:Uncharacterized protein n=1 Tax=Dendrothele bispora (strain CBS 962.96) TaxID=1314807 RepID=A0A4S8KQU1_DENBC|nr:hypothetical protein K435DRAFT_811878 [Dendrothele bispora CBS 962.96]
MFGDKAELSNNNYITIDDMMGFTSSTVARTGSSGTKSKSSESGSPWAMSPGSMAPVTTTTTSLTATGAKRVKTTLMGPQIVTSTEKSMTSKAPRRTGSLRTPKNGKLLRKGHRKGIKGSWMK